MTNSAANTACSRGGGYEPGSAQPARCFYIPCLLALLLVPGDAAAGSVTPSRSDPCYAAPGHGEKVRVKHVIDGDTVILADDRHIRLVGINAPETGRDGDPSESGAHEARKYLAGLLQDHPVIRLRYDVERRDRYGRTLGHLFLPDGTNVQAVLLERGLAIPLTIPPNLGFHDCYRGRAEAARAGARGLWSLPRYQPVPSDRITESHAGYRVVTGTVLDVRTSAAVITIRLTGHLALRIQREDQPYFEGVAFGELAGRRIMARGFLNPRDGRFLMRIRHPADLEVHMTPGRN